MVNDIWFGDLSRFEYMIESLIDQYREKLTLWNYYRCNGRTFYLYSYSIWALSELKEYVIFHYTHGTRDIEYCIEDYRDMMDEFTCSAKTEITNYMFSLAYDEVTNFLDLWLNRKEY